MAEKNQQRSFFDVESLADFDQIERDPDLFLRTNLDPMAIDEAQRLPALFPKLIMAATIPDKVPLEVEDYQLVNPVNHACFPDNPRLNDNQRLSR